MSQNQGLADFPKKILPPLCRMDAVTNPRVSNHNHYSRQTSASLGNGPAFVPPDFSYARLHRPRSPPTAMLRYFVTRSAVY